MNQHTLPDSRTRLFESLMVGSATFSLALVSAFVIPGSRKLEPVSLGALWVTLVMAAQIIKPFFEWKSGKNFLLATLVIAFFFFKHLLFPVSVHTSPFLSYSLVFSLGQAFGSLSVVELYQYSATKTRVVCYTLFVMICASYSVVTHFLWPCLFLYALCLILFNIGRFHSARKRKKTNLLVRGGAIGAMLFFSFFPCIPLMKYREQINDWRPFDGLFFGSSTQRISGFTHLSLLSSKNIETSREPVLRYFAPRKTHHLRGKAFNRYENGKWGFVDQREILLPQKEVSSRGNRFDRPETPEMHLESKEEENRLVMVSPFTSVLFTPLDWRSIRIASRNLSMDQEGIVKSSSFPVSYSMTIGPPLPVTLTGEEKSIYLRLPQEHSDYFHSLSEEITKGSRSLSEKVARIQEYLEIHYPYTTKTQLEERKDPIRSFLELKKGGHCEMFASAFVMLARAQGIPCRYVAGYYAHEWNRWGKFLTVRSCDAHAWCEVHFPDKGWRTIDPTPSDFLEQTLLGYRGWGEGIREWMSEWFRRAISFFLQIGFFRTAASLALAVFLSWVCWSVKRAMKKRRAKRTGKKMFPPLPPELKALYEQVQSDYFLRPKLPQETLRDYFSQDRLKKRVPQEACQEKCEEWMAQVLLSLERSLYAEEVLSSDAIHRLQKEGKEFSPVEERNRHGRIVRS